MDSLAVKHLRRPRRRAPRAGDLLVAAPSLLDPNFRRAVVYLLQHDDDGSAGVILNRPSGRSLEGLDLPDWVVRSGPMREGGPVADDSLLALALTDAAPEPVRKAIGPDVCVVDLDALPDVDPFAPLRLFVGYAGWGEGQLASELARSDWHVVSAQPGDVLHVAPQEIWRRVLSRQPDLTRLWATLPEITAAN